jgi:sucrose-6-phosphate hydrolase SacC (GH32 family)
MPFNQMMSFPVVLTLRTADDGIRMFAEPVREIESLHGKQHHWQDETVSPDSNLLRDVAGDLLHIRASFAAEGEFGFDVRGIPVVYNAAKQELTCGGKTVPMPPTDGVISIEILVDRASIEVFGNQGRIYMPFGVLLPEENTAMNLVVSGTTAILKSLDIWELKTIWK